MQHKRILLAIDASTLNHGVLDLVSYCLSGTNIHLTVYVIGLEKETKITHEALKDITEICALNAIELHLKLYNEFDADGVAKRCNFADLLIIQREILEIPEFSARLRENSCPVMILQENFHMVNHAILTVDGSRTSIRALKQFAQLFSERIKNIDVTLIFLMDDMIDFGRIDELLLVDYLKQYCGKLGVLKLSKPLTFNKLRAVKCDAQTLIVKTNTSSIEETYSKGLLAGFDPTKSMIFLPAEI